jgi:hypothetical protein
MERTDVERGTWDVVAGYAGQIAKMNRKQWRGEITRQACLKRKCTACRPPDMDVDPGIIQRAEKTQALYMVHVKMSEEDVDAAYVG